MAYRLALVDEGYASKLGKDFKDYQKVPPDMKQAVALAYARSTNDFDGLTKAYRESGSDEDKIRFLNAMTGFADEALLLKTLGLALSGEVKRQDVVAVIGAAAEKPHAGDTIWSWLQLNIERIRDLYHNTGVLSGMFGSLIPILGVGKSRRSRISSTSTKCRRRKWGSRPGLKDCRHMIGSSKASCKLEWRTVLCEVLTVIIFSS